MLQKTQQDFIGTTQTVSFSQLTIRYTYLDREHSFHLKETFLVQFSSAKTPGFFNAHGVGVVKTTGKKKGK